MQCGRGPIQVSREFVSISFLLKSSSSFVSIILSHLWLQIRTYYPCTFHWLQFFGEHVFYLIVLCLFKSKWMLNVFWSTFLWSSYQKNAWIDSNLKIIKKMSFDQRVLKFDIHSNVVFTVLYQYDILCADRNCKCSIT